MVVVLAIDLANEPTLAHPAPAGALVGAALAFTGWSTWAAAAEPLRLLRTPVLVLQGVLAVGLVVADQWAYGVDNVHSQSLGSIWPLAWVMAVGVRAGWRGGLVAGFGVGMGTWLSDLAFVPGRWYGDRITAALGGIVLYALGGGVAGFVADRLRQAEKEIAVARAREEVARTLHDGVLQTLAVVQRRSDDGELVGLAREQELELREFLFGTSERERARRRRPSGPPDDAAPGVEGTLRHVAARAEIQHGLRVEVVAAGDLPELSAAATGALRGAVAEALANAAHHGGATRAVVFLDPLEEADELFCSVKDDGAGFDADGVEEGIGMSRSIRARVVEVGGRVEVAGRPGSGAEIRLWVPVGPTADRG
jgi:signal transduction histidine kinase